MRCPRCGGHNPPTARFCGQCHDRLTAPATPDHPTVDDPAAGPTATRAAAGRFALVDGQATWRCAVCGDTTPADRFSCATCGTRMDVESGARDRLPPPDRATARRAERLVPGLGHLRAGATGMGLARMGLALGWAVGALALLLGGGPGAGATAAPLVLGVLAVWVTGPDEVGAVLAGRTPRLGARGLAGIVVAVTLGVIVVGGIAVAA